MTTTNHLDVLKALRDEVNTCTCYWNGRGEPPQEPARTPAQIAALDHIIKQQESLADAEGYAEQARVRELETEVETEVERLRKALERMITFAEYARYELEDKHSQMEQFPCKECCDKELATARAAIKELTTARTALAEKE